ncbi:CHAT domain-containing tetratricopeptide repeat protein [Streptomyces sp. CRN 30]|uniref:CHAT domain-containing protein n=1 Tax=Streptomyces sp. CRN 30 TaxID=3075613 RepID=UPI002A81B4D9|nr:CHAT domain-containing tetratricopeptide repeat protein [Streptomyces sp. CRN 30]
MGEDGVARVGWAERVREAERLLAEGEIDGAIGRFEAALGEGGLDDMSIEQECDIRRSLARLHKTRDDYPAARAQLDAALARLRSHPGTSRVEALVLVDLASVQREQGENSAAVGLLSRALAVSGAGDDEVLAAVRVERGIVSKDLGRLTAAREDLEEGLRLAERAGLSGLAGHARTALGLLAELLNDFAAAERHYRAARRLYRSIPDAENESIIWHNLGVLHDKRDRPADALGCYRKALALDEALGSVVGVADNLSAMASLLQVRGDSSGARTLHARALELYARTGHKRGAVAALVDLAILDRQTGEPVDDHLREALALAEQVGDPRDVADVRFVWGDCHLVAGRSRAAFAQYLEAARAQSALRDQLSERDALDYFDESRGDEVLDRLVRLSAEQGEARRALMGAEAAKGRELVRRLAAAGPSADLAAQGRAPRGRAPRGRAARGRATQGRTPQGRVARGKAAQGRVAALDPELALFATGEDVWYTRLQTLLRRLGGPDRPCHLVEFHLAEDTAVVFVCRADMDEPVMVPVAIDRGLLRDVTRRSLLGGAPHADRNKEWTELVAPLLAPLGGLVPPDDRIVLVPHDALHRVPLHAVPVRGTPLGLRNLVTYAPSATVLQHIRQWPPATGEALVIDTSGHAGDLVFASEQATSVSEALAVAGHRVTVLPAPVAGRRPPGRRAVLAALRTVDGPRVLHIAGHGRFDPRRPMRSGVPLGRQSLTAHDFAELDLRCELVTVGTCESGVVDRRPGDELLGLARALVIAGAQALLLSLWEVDQLSTGMLLRRFYQAWLAEGRTKADALRTAQQALRASTARDARRYARQARGRTALGAHDVAAITLAEAKVCLAARDFAAADTSAADAVASLALSAEERAEAERVRRMARLGGRQGVAPDYDRRLYDDMRHWAAFVLVGLDG